MNKFLTAVTASLLIGVAATAQIKNSQVVTVPVSGKCGMCQKAIVAAANEKKVSQAEWNADTKQATITYDAKATTADAILKKVALAGYDNTSYLAPTAAYAQLENCCKYDRTLKPELLDATPATTEAPMHHAAAASEEAPMASKDAAITQLLADYFALKDALVESNGNKAADAANKLLANHAAVKMDELSNDAHNAWMKAKDNLKTTAQKIASSKDIAQQRAQFEALSNNMIELAKSTKGANKTYVQYCPMYNKGKGGNWLSQESAIANPYYGSMMMTCGSVTETIDN